MVASDGTNWAGRPSFRRTLQVRLTASLDSTKTRAGPVKKLPIVFAGLLWTTTASAQSTEEWDGGYGTRSERRSGFTFGLESGLQLGNVHGYPKDAVKLNDPRYEADTDLALGPLGRLWLGGAIRDWFAFGVGLERIQARGNGLVAGGGAAILRPEIYPLWSLGGPFRDLGVHADFGIAWMKIKSGDATVADGGTLARVGFGVFHESVRWKHLGIGPTLGVSHLFSETLKATLVEVGVRIAVTTGP